MNTGEDSDTGSDPSREVAAVILHTNDIHCGAADNIGYDGLVLYKKELEQRFEHVFLVDCGDAPCTAARIMRLTTTFQDFAHAPLKKVLLAIHSILIISYVRHWGTVSDSEGRPAVEYNA